MKNEASVGGKQQPSGILLRKGLANVNHYSLNAVPSI